VRRMFVAAKARPLACFVTFTYKEKFATHSHKAAGADFSAFCDRLRRKYKDRYTVVAVPERHKSGRIHIHALLFGGIFVTESESNELKLLWGKGGIKIKGRELTPKLCYYVAKYITKQEEDPEFSVKSYWSSQGLDKSLEFVDDEAEWYYEKLKGKVISSTSRGSVYFGKIIREKKIRTI